MEKPYEADKEFVGTSKNEMPAPPKAQGIGQFKLQLSLAGTPIGWFGLTPVLILLANSVG